jgi:molybdate transport system substrate-binding protein
MMIAARFPAPVVVIASSLLILGSACGADPGSPAGPPGVGSPVSAAPITVFAAASLTDVFTHIGQDFQARSGSRVTFNFGASSTLATQINQGAPADVFAAASPATMRTVTDTGGAGTPVNFASNTLQIAVPEGNPARITGLADFADESKLIAICAPQVPCGVAAEQAFASAEITPEADTLEQDVKATLAKVAANEVDAALVYTTDVIGSPDEVDGIDFPESSRAGSQYPIATLAGSKAPEVSQDFVDYVLSADGQAVLTKAGFAQP